MPLQQRLPWLLQLLHCWSSAAAWQVARQAPVPLHQRLPELLHLHLLLLLLLLCWVHPLQQAGSALQLWYLQLALPLEQWGAPAVVCQLGACGFWVLCGAQRPQQQHHHHQRLLWQQHLLHLQLLLHCRSLPWLLQALQQQRVVGLHGLCWLLLAHIRQHGSLLGYNAAAQAQRALLLLLMPQLLLALRHALLPLWEEQEPAH